MEDWLQVEARSKLIECCERLGLQESKLSGKHLQSKQMEELQVEKKKVKNELKAYDQAFLGRFGRVPNRVEKEPMRQMYLYYKRLK